MEDARQILQMILDERQKALKKVLTELSWQDHGLTVLKLCEAAGRAQRTGSWHRMSGNAQELMGGAIAKMRERLERVTPEDMIKIANRYYETTRVAGMYHYAAVFLGSQEQGDAGRAVRLFSLFNSSRLRLWGGLQRQEEQARSACAGLHLMFGGLITSAPNSRTWFQFLQAVAADAPGARKEFEQVCAFPALFTECDIEFIPYADWLLLPCSAPKNEEEVLAYLFTSRGTEARNVKLPAPFEIASSLNRIQEQCLLRYDKAHQRLMHLLTWFHAKRKLFTDLKQAMWREMQTAPRAALRPGGQDWVRIAVDDLNTPVSSYRGVTLIPIDPFPAVDARFDSLFFGEFCNLAVRVESPTAYSDTSTRPKDHPDRILKEILEYLVIDCCWRIITEKDSQSGIVSVAVNVPGTRRSSGRKTIKHPAVHVVRAKFKRLPAGFRASGEAIGRALAHPHFGITPPEGMTFRRDYVRGLAAHGDPAERTPLFLYNEKDLGYDPPESV